MLTHAHSPAHPLIQSLTYYPRMHPLTKPTHSPINSLIRVLTAVLADIKPSKRKRKVTLIPPFPTMREK